jgi:hypothetical protein
MANGFYVPRWSKTRPTFTGAGVGIHHRSIYSYPFDYKNDKKWGFRKELYAQNKQSRPNIPNRGAYWPSFY